MKTSRSHQRHQTNLAAVSASDILGETEKQWRFLHSRENRHLLFEGVEESLFHDLELNGLIAESGDIRRRDEDDDYYWTPGMWSPERCAAMRQYREEREAKDPYHPLQGVDLLYKDGHVAIRLHIGQNGDRAAYDKFLQLC